MLAMEKRMDGGAGWIEAMSDGAPPRGGLELHGRSMNGLDMAMVAIPPCSSPAACGRAPDDSLLTVGLFLVPHAFDALGKESARPIRMGRLVKQIRFEASGNDFRYTRRPHKGRTKRGRLRKRAK